MSPQPIVFCVKNEPDVYHSAVGLKIPQPPTPSEEHEGVLAAPTPRSGMPSSVCFDLLTAAPEGKKER